jgi:conjugal transfer pilus assembly protein TraW
MATSLKLILLANVFALFSNIEAKDLGMHGHVYEIQEEDFLEVLKRRMEALDKEKVLASQKKIQNDIANSFKEPRPVEDISKAQSYRSLFYGPTVCAQEDITNEKGEVIIAKGKCINPLTLISTFDDLLFFDATDVSQIAWAKKQAGNMKWILVKGRPLDLEEKEQRPVYFDQFGYLTKKFKINRVPAKVSWVEDKLKIEELPISEDGSCAS